MISVIVEIAWEWIIYPAISLTEIVMLLLIIIKAPLSSEVIRFDLHYPHRFLHIR